MHIKERPILMAGRMAQGCHEGWKGQTRRTIKGVSSGNWRYDGMGIGGEDREYHYMEALNEHGEPTEHYWNIGKCPFGVVGDRLWVRETWCCTGQGVWTTHDAHTAYFCGLGKPIYRADETDCESWFPSIHMPRWACRTVLELTDVRVERLQDISEEDAKAEGIQVLPLQDADDPSAWWQSAPGVHQARTARESFSLLWDSLAKPGEKWEDNPWVWRLAFRRVEDE